ncbi:transglutaminase family protein [Frateuria sp. Soil773]|uniref:transglutaminase family protein n=1 Tax=Frateuria sp. Soil773 TaxID=1736407 RepID=UPI00138EF4F7|nr:transglutaminase family protein [Frateuria sp. Soil773]
MIAFMAASPWGWTQTPGTVPSPNDPNIQVLEQLANAQDGVDYAKVQTAIERAVKSSFDATAFNAELDSWANLVRARVSKGAPPTEVMTALGQVIYTPGPWNNNRPFSYDLDDPLGAKYQNKLVSTYLRTRKGNCVSMPTLLIILGQKLGLNMTLSQAPQHEFARLQDANGRWFNIEATNPGSPPDSKYINELHVTPLSIQSGIYLRTTTPQETVAAMLEPLEGIYAHTRPPGYLLGLAKLAQRIDPKNAAGYVNEANAYFLTLTHRYLTHHLTPEALPPMQRADFNALYGANTRVMNRVRAMGWAPPTQAGDKEYLERVDRYRSEHGK